jgi:hypothetical protein
MHDEFNLVTLARALCRHKGLVALVVIVCVVLAGGITLALPKIYRAQISVFFPEATETGFGAALQAALAQSPAGMLIPSISGLAVGSQAAGLCKAVAESYVVRAKICREFDLQRHFECDHFQDATDKLRDATWTEITPEGVLKIRVDTDDRKLSADIANAYGRIVERLFRDATVARAHDERIFLERRVAGEQRDLHRAQAELARYQRSGAALLGPDELPPILQKVIDLRVDQAKADVELEAARREVAQSTAALNRIAKDGSSEPSRPAGSSLYAVPWEMNAETIADNPDIAQIRAELVGLEVKLAAARHDLSPEHPDVKRLQSEIDETHNRLAAEARKTLTTQVRMRNPVYAAALEQLVAFEASSIGHQARSEGLKQLVQQVEGQARSLPARLLQYSQLELDVRTRTTVYTTLEAQLEAARLKELQQQPVFQVLDPAVPPQRHDRPKLAVNLVVGFLFGLFLGAAIAAALGAPQPGPRGE